MKIRQKHIEGFGGDYIIYSDGRIFSKKQKARFLKQQINGRGAFCVFLYKNNKSKGYLVHRLVALTFIPNPKNKPYVNHIDGNKHNNNVENLKWVTENERQTPKGEKSGNAKLTEEQILEMREKAKTRKRGEKIWLEYGIVASTYYCIISRRAWKHI